MEETSCGIMKEFLENEGLSHLVRNISSFLDRKSLAQCRRVCHSWKDLIDNDRCWLIFQLEHIHNVKKVYNGNLKSIKEKFPEWNAFIEEASKKQNIPRLKEMVNDMWIYFKNESNNFNNNPLHHAVEDSKIGFVQLLIKSGINLEMRNAIGWTPMHLASRSGTIEMVKLVIMHNQTFDPSSRTAKGTSIFQCAVQHSDLQVTKLIFDTFKLEDSRDKDGWTILHCAVKFGSKEAIEFLIKSRQKLGINIEERTAYLGSTILHLACLYKEMEIVDFVHNQLEEINSNINFNTRNEAQETPLHFACKNKTSDVAIHLLQRYPDKINVLGSHAKHVLHNACQFGHLELLKHIFRNPDFVIDINVVDSSGDTPLHYACYFGQFDIVKFLLENSNQKGIDIAKMNNSQQTAEDLARQQGHKDISELLELWTYLMLKLRQKLGINIEERTDNGATILHLACKHRVSLAGFSTWLI